MRRFSLFLTLMLCTTAMFAGIVEDVEPVLPYAEMGIKPYLGQVKFALPLVGQIDLTDTEEMIFVEVTKEGKIELAKAFDGRPDLKITTTSEMLTELATSKGSPEDAMKKLNDNPNFIVKGYGFKGGTLINAVENMFKLKFRQPVVKDAVQGVTGAVTEVVDVGISLVGTMFGFVGSLLGL